MKDLVDTFILAVQTDIRNINSPLFDSYCIQNSSPVQRLVNAGLLSRAQVERSLESAITSEAILDYDALITRSRNKKLRITVDSYVLSNGWFAYGILRNIFSDAQLSRLSFESSKDKYLEKYGNDELPRDLTNILLTYKTPSITPRN